jgi:hypothetical protein
MTIEYAYQYSDQYYDFADLVDRGIDISTVPRNMINNGNRSELCEDTSHLPRSEPVYLAENASGSEFYIPNLPNGKDGSGTFLDHDGLTENVAWTVDPYLNNLTYSYSDPHMIQYGWAYDPKAVIDYVVWKNVDGDGVGQKGSDYPVVTNVGNQLVEIITGNNYQLQDILDKIEIDYPLGTDPAYPFANPTWLEQGAFLMFQPMPGFQRNLLRHYTSGGTWTPLNNTSGVFVRSDGRVEIPAVVDAQGKAVQPFPLVVQTWKDQKFTVLNKTQDIVPYTNDGYPGDEMYYMGNTFLPGHAGVVTSWVHYPHNHFRLDPGINIDERDSDGWLGLKADKQEDVMAWNDFGGDPGGQGRKPYMIGAGEFNRLNPSDPQRRRYKFRIEHSNSFFIPRLSGNDSSLDQMYQVTFYVDPGDRDYRKIGAIWWEFQKWNYTDPPPSSVEKEPLSWKNSADGKGCWVHRAVWQLHPNVNGLPTGWVFDGEGTIAGPNGHSINVKASKANWKHGKWDYIDWSEQASLSSTPANNLSGNIYKWTLSADLNAADIDDPNSGHNIKLLVVLEDVP